MKKLLLFILLIFSVGVYGQSTKDITNSTDTPLDSAGVFQPTAWRNVIGYNSLTLSISSNRSSASSGVKIYFATLVGATYRVMDSVTTTYTTGTVFKLTLPIIAPYLRVKYTNTTAVQTTFSFTIMLFVGQQFNFADEGGVIVDSVTVSGSALPTGAAKETKQDTQIAKEDSIVDMTTSAASSLDNIEADVDSTVDMVTAIHADVDGLQISADTSNARLQEIKLDVETSKSNSNTQLGYSHPSGINWGADSVSVTTAVDSLTFSGATVKWKLRIFSLDGTIIVSTDPTFATNTRIAYAWTEIFPYENMSVVSYPKIYFKASSGTVKINYSGEGY